MSGSTSDTEPPDWRRMLTREERARMLDDIARVSLAAGARLFPDQPWQDLDVSAGSLGAHKSPVERLGFIECTLPLLTQAAAQIGRDPLAAALSQARPVASALRARRVTTTALLQAARRGPSLRSLEETVTVLSHDTPENRAVKSFLRMLGRDCAAIARIAEAEEEAEAAHRAARCGLRLHGLTVGSWWEEVGDEGAAWTKPPTRRAAGRPEYARVFQEMARYRAGFGFDWGHPWLTLPPREAWRLYETWCLFAVLDALRALDCLPAAEAASDRPGLFAVREGRLTFTLAMGTSGQVALRSLEGRRLSLVYHRTFAEGRHSLTHTMQPDITLASGDSLWILDAKFKPYALGGEEGDDINQMHAYRDGIVDEAGRRVVARAWCLYAGQADAPNRSHLTYGRSAQSAVGALCLRPGDTETFMNLCALLAGWLREASPTTARPAFPRT
jgi:hypothetical protein